MFLQTSYPQCRTIRRVAAEQAQMQLSCQNYGQIFMLRVPVPPAAPPVTNVKAAGPVVRRPMPPPSRPAQSPAAAAPPRQAPVRPPAVPPARRTQARPPLENKAALPRTVARNRRCPFPHLLLHLLLGGDDGFRTGGASQPWRPGWYSLQQ